MGVGSLCELYSELRPCEFSMDALTTSAPDLIPCVGSALQGSTQGRGDNFVHQCHFLQTSSGHLRGL